MGNSKTSRFADGQHLYDLNNVTSAWLRGLVAASQFELVAPSAAGIGAKRRLPRKRLTILRDALGRAPTPVPVSTRRGAGEVQRMLMDPDVAPRLRQLARKRRHDEGDVASVWAHVRVSPRDARVGSVSEAGTS